MKQLAYPLLIALTSLLCACGGGGGGGENNSATSTEVSNSSLTVSWQQPAQRSNGNTLPSSEIQGYVLVYIPMSDIVNGSVTIDNFPSKEQFLNNGEQLATFIQPWQLQQLIESGHPNIVVVDGNSSEYTLQDLSPDTYFVAVSTYDTNYLYSRLSSTVSASSSS